MKTICISHSRDLDGWMSAAIVKKYYEEQKYCSVCEKPLHKDSCGSTECCGGITTHDEPEFLGWDYGDKIPDLSEYDKVIMVDVAFPGNVMLELNKRLGSDFVWLDHHISAIKDVEKAHFDFIKPNGLRDDKLAACEITWNWFFPRTKMPEIVRLLGMYDSFRHKGDDEEQKVLEFQYGARASMSNYEDCYDKLYHSLLDGACYIEVLSSIQESGKFIYNYLCTEAQQTYKKAFPIEFKIEAYTSDVSGNDKEDVSKIYKFLCVNQERFNPVNFGIDYHKGGYDGFACFWLKNGKWHWSLYNDNRKVDCSVIAKLYEGGGHRGAAGMVISSKEMLSLIGL